MTQPTVTLREAAQQALDALVGLFKVRDDGSGGVAVWRIGGSHAPREAIKTLRAALDAPAKPITQQMIDAGVAAMYQGAWESDAAEVKSILMAALGASATVDCRGCFRYTVGLNSGVERCTLLAQDCTDFDKFQALPPISLTKVTK